MLEAINARDDYLITAHSISVSKIGYYFAGAESGLEVDTFLPMPKKEDTSKQISVQTAKMFMKAVRLNQIPNKVVSAFTPYMEQLISLSG